MRVNKLSGIVMRLAVILLCLVLFSVHLSSGMFARYSTSTSAQDDARAARYDIAVTQVKDFVFDAQGNGTYIFKVTNQSEVPVKYQLSIDLDIDTQYMPTPWFNTTDYDNTPAYQRLVSDVKLNDVAGASDSTDGSRYTFSSLGGVLKVGETADYTLTLKTGIIARYEKGVSTYRPKDQWDAIEIPITCNILVDSEQID